MARITTKQALIHYTKVQLGYPTIQVEVTDEQMSYIIDDVVQKFTEYSYGTLEESVVVDIAGAGEYKLPGLITNILKLSKGSSASGMNFDGNYGEGLVPDMWTQQYVTAQIGGGGIFENIIPVMNTQAMYSKYFGDDLNCNFNPHRKILQVLENYTGKCLLHYNYEYIADEEYDLVYNHEWVKGYTRAKVKQMWGTVTGKFDQTLVGGARVNYDRFLSEAQSELEELDRQLLDRWSDPCPMFVG